MVVGQGAHAGPLPPRDPLHVGGELAVAHEVFLVRADGQPRFRFLEVLMLGRPLVPERVVAVFVEQRAEERVARQPAHVVFHERLELVGRVTAFLQIDRLEFHISAGKHFQLEHLQPLVRDRTGLQFLLHRFGKKIRQRLG
jgi:hypothetical protein